MQITVLASPSSPHQNLHQQAMADGLRAIGHEPILRRSGSSTKHVACWGWRMGRMLQQQGCSVLVMERGYLGDRFEWTSLAWNGLNGHGEFPETPDDGGEKFRRVASLKPWKTDGKYALLLGQVPGDQSLQGRDMRGWYEQTALEAQNKYEMDVVFRAHPVALQKGHRFNVKNATRTISGTLQEALEDAFVAITFNSNSSVDAALAGVPVVTLDKGSMAWDVAAHHIGAVLRPDRTDWAHRLARKQWTIDSIASGEALLPYFKDRHQ